MPKKYRLEMVKERGRATAMASDLIPRLAIATLFSRLSLTVLLLSLLLVGLEMLGS